MSETVKRFPCDVEGCDKSYDRNDSLQTHKLTHTGMKTHLCDVEGCNDAFATSSNLWSHKASHNLRDTLKCTFDGCNQEFKLRGNFTDHIRRHLGEKGFPCPEESCGYEFATQGDLIQHTKSHHTVEGQIKKKKEEARIIRFLETKGFDFKPQHTIDFKCLGDLRDGDRCFIDFVIMHKDENGAAGLIFLEVDENQHIDYGVSCELRRMSHVASTLMLEGNTLPIVFIRYNPHLFKVDGKTVASNKKDKEASLADTMSNWIFKQPFAVHYMFYDKIGTDPAIFFDPFYNESFKELVTIN